MKKAEAEKLTNDLQYYKNKSHDLEVKIVEAEKATEQITRIMDHIMGEVARTYGEPITDVDTPAAPKAETVIGYRAVIPVPDMKEKMNIKVEKKDGKFIIGLFTEVGASGRKVGN